jgi:hypothetical protein
MIVVVSAEAAHAQEEKIPWGKEVNGLVIAVTPRDKDPGKLTIRYRNVGKETLELQCVRVGSNAAFTHCGDLLTDADDKFVPVRMRKIPAAGDPADRPRTVILAPEKVHTETLDLWTYVEMPAKDGRFQLAIALEVKNADVPSQKGAKYWTGKVQSNLLEYKFATPFKAWNDAGLKAGWVRMKFGAPSYYLDPDAGADALPAYWFNWEAKRLAKLPDPGVPFGLYLNGTNVGDAGLKELAHLKNLQLLNLDATKVTDAGLKELVGLKSLQSLSIPSVKVTDAGLKELARLKNLRSLSLHLTTQVTGAGLKELASLKNLESLDLRLNTEVTDAVLKELAGLKNLQYLDLDRTQVTDAGLKELANVKSLQSLDLSGTQVTDAGMKELVKLTNLRSLNLGFVAVTDAGMKDLAGLKSLKTLKMFPLKGNVFLPDGGGKFTDTGLKELARMKSLESMMIDSINLTQAGVDELRRALPKCRVELVGGDSPR